MGIRDLFKPKPDKFLQLLVEQTRLTVRGLELLTAYMKKHEPSKARELVMVEKEADEVRRVLVEELLHTFVTPFDREDIFALSREIDDVLDYARTTVEEMETLDVESTSYMERMASLLFDAAKELQLAVERMETRHFTVASDHAQRAKGLENRVESVYREALADLFKVKKNVDSARILEILKQREIYRHLSNSSDREDTAANVIADIIMKMS